MLYTYLCATALLRWCGVDAFFKYAEEDGGYQYCWTLPFVRRYEPWQAREQAIEAIKTQLNASFCDISFINTVDPWLKHNQTRYKLFIISEFFKDLKTYERHNKVKEIVQPILQNPSDSRVEIVANTLEEKPEGKFTEAEMKYIVTFLDEKKMPIFGGNRIKRDVMGAETEYIDEKEMPLFGGNRIKREVVEYPMPTDDMSWKYPPNKTCALVEEIIREKFDPIIVKCESLHELLRGKVGPGHEDQYKLLVVSKKFLDQPPLRRTINVRRSIEELVIQQMYKIHMTLKTEEEYTAESNIQTTMDFSVFL